MAREAQQAPIGWPGSITVGVLAAASAVGLMFWARAAFQIRTLPERVMEWLLLFVPLDLFERGLQQFGPQAKDLALYGAIAAMTLLLVGLGAFALRRGWSGWALLLLGGALWLFAMAVVMPLTGAGFFARDLFQDARLVNLSYLGVALAYVTVLLLGRLLLRLLQSATSSNLQSARSDRRPFLTGLAGLVASYAAVVWISRDGTTSRSSLPLAQIPPSEPVPTLVPATPAGTPEAPATAASPTSVPPASASPQPILDTLPVPSPPRELSRDKDGSLTAAGRKPGELSPLITTNADFYVVTKNAGGDPLIKPETWRLIVDGDVNNPIQIDYPSLRRLPAVEQVKTLECISNLTAMCELTSFGCDLISTARWKGVRVADVLNLAGGAKQSAQYLAVLSTDEFSSAIPIEVALDPDTILAYQMNGEVLPYEHGYPARLLVPGRYGMKSAKWVMALRPMSQQVVDWYGQRNWNRQGIVKTMSRIDLPAPGSELPPGTHRIAGIAYAGDRGVKLVEFSADGGTSWQPARFLEPPSGKDAVVRWEGSFTLTSRSTTKLVARATDGDGELQTETFSLPQPDGGSGRHSIEVKARPA